MANYKKLAVKEIIEERDGLQKLRLSDESRAYNILQNTGLAKIGDEVVVNTTAIDLNLGTGGWHFVTWNLNSGDISTQGSGHIMKMRYSGYQFEAGVEEEFENYPAINNIDGAYVIAAPLFSQVAPIATLLKRSDPKINVSLVVSDSAALPLVIADLLIEMKSRNLIDSTVTFGHAFGGDHEAINIFTALLTARNIAKADVIIVTMGPGIVGTGTEFGFTGIDVAYHLDTAKSLGAKTYGVLRASSADPRDRHQGISHHSITTFTKATHEKHKLGLIDNDKTYTKMMKSQLDLADLYSSHEIVEVPRVGIVQMMEDINLNVSSMGRSTREDELFFESAAASASLVLKDMENN